MRLLKIAICALALAAFTAPSAHADDWNKKTFLTFSGPVQVPGVTLPAGTYMFKLADLETNRHVVQIFDKDGGKLIATFLTVPDYKTEAPKDNVVMFEERPRNMPAAVKAWWYVGDPTGDEFVYPKSQAMKIAKATHESVLASNDEKAGASKGTKVGRVNESGEVRAQNEPGSPLHPSAPAATGTTGTTAATTGTSASQGTTTGTTARRSTNAQPTTAAPAKTTRTELPRTASSLPLMELLALASFVGAFIVRSQRKRIGNA
jgi:hypothetical protein